jgi:hypothetical protein
MPVKITITTTKTVTVEGDSVSQIAEIVKRVGGISEEDRQRRVHFLDIPKEDQERRQAYIRNGGKLSWLGWSSQGKPLSPIEEIDPRPLDEILADQAKKLPL